MFGYKKKKKNPKEEKEHYYVIGQFYYRFDEKKNIKFQRVEGLLLSLK